MSKRVFVDPERLRQFAVNLKSFRSNVTELTGHLSGKLAHLSDSWKDQEFANFKQMFETAQQRLKVFAEEVEQIAPKLERNAQAAEEIHNVKPPTM